MQLSFHIVTQSFSAKEKIINSCKSEITFLRTTVAKQIEKSYRCCLLRSLKSNLILLRRPRLCEFFFQNDYYSTT